MASTNQPKDVYVRKYVRTRFDKVEEVTDHWRSRPL